MDIQAILTCLGDEAEDLLGHRCEGIPKSLLHLPGPDFVDRVLSQSDRRPGVLRNLQAMFGQGRLANTGYLSILPVDQGVEHSGGASFAPTLSTLTRPTSSNWLWPVAATPSPPPWGCWAAWAVAMPTRFPSWSSSTTTKC